MRWKEEGVPLVVCFLCILVWVVFMLFNLELLGYVFSHEGGGVNIGLLGVVVIGLAVIGGAFLMAWAAEAGQFIFSQAFALALLALLEVFPEYMFEASLAWKRCIELAAATMTGSNRLLLGAGWPLVFFIYALSCKRKSGKLA
ncbi:sodium:calcium antiporter, partial [archaeon]